MISQINLSAGAMSEIRNEINAGKQVTTHQSNINYKGWTGSDYIILDPTSGTGAYLIDGGANGGILLIVLGFLLIAVAIFALVALIATTGGGWSWSCIISSS